MKVIWLLKWIEGFLWIWRLKVTCLFAVAAQPLRLMLISIYVPFFNLCPLINRKIGYVRTFYFTFKNSYRTNFVFSIYAFTAGRATRICFDEVIKDFRYIILEGTYTFCDKYNTVTHFTQTAWFWYALTINKLRVNFGKIVHLSKGDILREFRLESFAVSAGISIQNLK